MSRPDQRIDSLCLEVDLRLRQQWAIAYEMDDIDAFDLEMVASLMRSSYVQGYTDALTERVPGTLHKAHGYRVPDRER